MIIYLRNLIFKLQVLKLIVKQHCILILISNPWWRTDSTPMMMTAAAMLSALTLGLAILKVIRIIVEGLIVIVIWLQICQLIFLYKMWLFLIKPWREQWKQIILCLTSLILRRRYLKLRIPLGVISRIDLLIVLLTLWCLSCKRRN